MISDPQKRLIEALKNVDEHGDVAPAHVHDPMTMVLRGNAIQAVYRTSKAALNTMMRARWGRASGGSSARVRPTSAHSLPVQYRRLGQYVQIAHPSSTSCRDCFGLVAAGWIGAVFLSNWRCHLGYRLSCISVRRAQCLPPRLSEGDRS